MATDLERLVVQLSADFKQFERSMARAQGVSNKQFNAIERRARQLNSNLDNIFKNTFNGLLAPLSGIGAALGAREILRLADTWTELKSRVDLAAGGLANGEVVLGRLSEMARRTYSGLEQTAESWLSNSTALRELGYSTQQQLDLVETLNNALVISAAKGQRAESVMTAWSKAMALGKLSGDNLNTVIQSGGRLAEALAASMGVTTNQLRKLGADGKITTTAMYGVTSQLAKLRAEADGMQATVGDAMQLLRDALLQYVGGADQASQMSATLAESIILVADNFTSIADTALQLAAVIIGALTGRAIVGLVAAIPAATTGIMALVAAMRAGTLTAAGFSAALGPVGLALGAASVALTLYAKHQSDAEFATEKFTAAAELNAKAIDTGRDAHGRYTQALRDQIAMQVEAARAAYTTANAQFEAAAKTAAAFAVMTGLRASPLDYRMNTAEGEAASLFDALVKLEDQLAAIDKAGVTQNKIISPVDDDGKKKKPKKEREDEYQRLAERIAETTANLVAETEVQRQLNPLIDDYGYAVEKARSEQELLNAAKKAGVTVTPELRAQIAGLAEQYAVATVEAAKLAESQDEIRRKAEDMRDFQKDVTRGIVDGFIQGKKAADIFADALTKIGNRLLDLAFDSAFGGGSQKGFGFLGSLFGFSDGGYTGPGGVKQPAGVVHKGEVVWSQKDVARAGGVGAVEAMRLGHRGYAGGGPVAMPVIPRIQAPANQNGGGSITAPVSIHIDAKGADREGLARVEAQVAQLKSTLPSQIVKTVREMPQRRQG